MNSSKRPIDDIVTSEVESDKENIETNGPENKKPKNYPPELVSSFKDNDGRCYTVHTRKELKSTGEWCGRYACKFKRSTGCPAIVLLKLNLHSITPTTIMRENKGEHIRSLKDSIEMPGVVDVQQEMHEITSTLAIQLAHKSAREIALQVLAETESKYSGQL
jgi:hypothetical protein